MNERPKEFPSDIKLVIGLTGAFGSGCTTAARHLRDEEHFEMVRLSEALQTEWQKRNAGKEPSRFDLQKLGDELRQKGGPGIVVDMAIANLKARQAVPEHLVIDGIRNLGEIERLRDIFGYRFFLIAVLASIDDRWGRIGSTAYIDKGLTQADFIRDDQRDGNEEVSWGQQVQLCIDRADILISNSPTTPLLGYKKKVQEFVALVAGSNPRSALPEEILMNMAFSSSHSSKCLKRHVGALIVDKTDRVVGVGYNENPLGTKPCVEEPQYSHRCYRDIVRNLHFKNLSEGKMLCPVCGKSLPDLAGPPWNCPNCLQLGNKTDLALLFFPER